jgi:alcohol dehydrogenase
MARAMGEDVDALPAEQRPAAFLTALGKLIAGAGLAGLKLTDFGIRPDECPELARNAHENMGGLFQVDPYQLSVQDTVAIFQAAF